MFQGLAVAAHDGGNWHRVEIISVDDCEAYVLFVDRGCKKRVNLHTLRYLEKSFTTQSRKSAKGSLFGVKPKDGDKLWSIDATMVRSNLIILKFLLNFFYFQTLMAKTKDQELLATIKGCKNDIYELSVIIDIKQRARLSDFMLSEGLCDAMDDVDFSMSQILVSFLRNIKEFCLNFLSFRSKRLHGVSTKFPSSELSSRPCHVHNALKEL